jgi:hypothetical protein
LKRYDGIIERDEDADTKVTSRGASDFGNPAGITVSLPKGTTLKGMGMNRNFGKWLSYGRGILGTFG